MSGLYSDENTGPDGWATQRNTYDIVDIRAEWIWTDNPGRDGFSELGTDTRVYCRAVIPATCTNYQGEI